MLVRCDVQLSQPVADLSLQPPVFTALRDPQSILGNTYTFCL